MKGVKKDTLEARNPWLFSQPRSLHTSFHFTRLISAAQRLSGEAELSQLSQLFQIISIRS